MTRFTRMRILFSLAFSLALLSCATPSNPQSPPPVAGGTGWAPGDPLDTPVSDGTPVQLPGPPASMPDAGADQKAR